MVGAGAKSAVAGKTAKFEINSRDENGLLAPSLAKFEVFYFILIIFLLIPPSWNVASIAPATCYLMRKSDRRS